MSTFELPPHVELRAQTVEYNDAAGTLLRLVFADTKRNRLLTTIFVGDKVPDADRPALLRLLETWAED